MELMSDWEKNYTCQNAYTYIKYNAGFTSDGICNTKIKNNAAAVAR